jgi:hypothetical protein
MKKALLSLSGLSVGLSFVPLIASAQSTVCGATLGTLDYVICRVGVLLNSVVPILIALGVVYFVWGVVSYVIGEDEEAKSKGRDKMIYGLIGIVVIVSLWGLVGILRNSFNLQNSGNNAGQTPCIPIPGSPSYPNC